MAKLMKGAAALSAVMAAVFLLLARRFPSGLFPALAITCAAIAYHMLYRLLVGQVYTLIMKNRADYTRPWYRLHPWEEGLYRRLRVKRWKNRMPSYDPGLFDPQLHSWDEIAQAMCQAELVHESNIPLSFLPLLVVPRLGGFWPFLLTSLAAAILDLLFVILQRYNRPRVLRMARRSRAGGHGSEE